MPGRSWPASSYARVNGRVATIRLQLFRDFFTLCGAQCSFLLEERDAERYGGRRGDTSATRALTARLESTGSVKLSLYLRFNAGTIRKSYFRP